MMLAIGIVYCGMGLERTFETSNILQKVQYLSERSHWQWLGLCTMPRGTFKSTWRYYYNDE